MHVGFGLLKDIYRVVHASSPLVVGAALTFVAYMVGILSTGLLTRPIRVVLRLLLTLLVSLVGTLTHMRVLSSFLIPVSVLVTKVVLTFFAAPLGRAHSLVVGRIASRVLMDSEYRDTLIKRLDGTQLQYFRPKDETPRWHSRPVRGAEGLSNAWAREERTLEEDLTLARALELDERMQEEDLALVRKRLEEGDRRTAELLARCVVDVDRHARESLMS